MRHKALDLILLILFVIGGVLAWQSSRERTRLMATHAKLAAITGDFQVTDPTLVHVLALETGDPKHFAWRIYFPPGFNLDIRVGTGGGTFTRSSSTPSESIARVVLREDKNGFLEIYSRYLRGSSRATVGDKTLADLLRGRWEKLRMEQAGTKGTARLDPNKPCTLLLLSLPEDLQAEAHERLPARLQKQVIPDLIHIELIPRGSKP